MERCHPVCRARPDIGRKRSTLLQAQPEGDMRERDFLCALRTIHSDRSLTLIDLAAARHDGLVHGYAEQIRSVGLPDYGR